jgi:3-dehydroquinate synthase
MTGRRRKGPSARTTGRRRKGPNARTTRPRRKASRAPTPRRLRTVTVSLGERSYPIRLGEGCLGDVGPEIARRTGANRVALVTVPAVGRRYAGSVGRSLREAGLGVQRIDVPDGDASKNLRQMASLYDAFLAGRLERGSAVVALGGGMVGDLAGFAAATYLRGIPLVQIPTTVLAMVDASIGGKVAVNLPQGKNLVGAFHQPRLVWIDVATLRSLPARQRSAGFAEMVKAGALWDADFFGRLERDAEALMALDSARLLPALERACAIKAQVVARDERESGLRMLLNLGHTLAHAVEQLRGYRGILHGEAVAMGMVYAARRSEELGRASRGTEERLAALLRRFDLPTELPDHPRRAYLSALRVDKKSRDSRIRYIVLRRIGRAEAVDLTPAEILPSDWAGRAGGARRRRGRKRP